MNQELAQSEFIRLTRCEKAIEKGLGTFVEVGQALLDIRDAKLYRATHKTFETYCKERWDISRPRAYQLIEGAKTVQTIADGAGADLSTTVDKITERQARELKTDPAGAAAEIKDRAAKGEEPTAIIKDMVDRSREEKQQPLPKQADVVQPRAAARSMDSAPNDDEDPADRIEELEAINESITAENAALRAKVAELEPMRLEYERGGFAEVIKGMVEQIRVLKTRVESESQEKVKNLRSAEFWKRKASDAGYSRDAVIDLETLEEIKHG